MPNAIWTTNIRGIISNFTAFKHKILSSKPTMVTVCETFLSAEVPDTALTIPGYDFVRRDLVGHGGGLLLYFKTSLTIQRLPNLKLVCVIRNFHSNFVFTHALRHALRAVASESNSGNRERLPFAAPAWRHDRVSYMSAGDTAG